MVYGVMNLLVTNTRDECYGVIMIMPGIIKAAQLVGKLYCHHKLLIETGLLAFV